ncbi:hypothetical protein FGB62_17g551 [Gracilaria domingensis]|nr:hypothetical protein FGB62_17g551 [Gracilaria domingensis]
MECPGTSHIENFVRPKSMAGLLTNGFVRSNVLTRAANYKHAFKSPNSVAYHFSARYSPNFQRPRMMNIDRSPAKPTDKELMTNVLKFWFGSDTFPPFEIYKSQKDLWYGSSENIDADIRKRFGRETDEAISGRLDHWIGNTNHGFKSDLALVVMLDQFPRNIYRGSEKAFSGDTKSRAVVKRLLDTGGWDDLKHNLSPVGRLSFLLSLMHQESLEDQNECIELIESMIEECKSAGKQAVDTTKILHESLYFAQMHRDIIEQFGRFPHRNKALSRPSTPEEERYLVNGPRFGQ